MPFTLSLSSILSLLLEYKYAILFPALIIEGPMTTVIAAFLASRAGGNVLNIVWVFYIVVAADLVGDAFYYFVGRFGKQLISKNWNDRLGFTNTNLLKFENYFKRHGPKTLVLAKITHGIGWAAMVGAGAARMPFGKFITVSSLVTIPKSLVLLALGYYYGKSYEAVSEYISTTGFILLTIILIFLIFYFFRIKKASSL
jgi:membrane protein DedA with SNARE-associated domain